MQCFPIRKLFVSLTTESVSNFDVEFLEPAKDFIDNLDEKTKEKVLFNIWRSKEINDPRLLKKLNKNIWEFRTRIQNKQIRLFAFWDKRDNKTSLIIATHGIIKKAQKIQSKEISKAEELRKEYFEFN